MGRDLQFSLYLTPEIKVEGARTVDLANKLMDAAALHGCVLTDHNPKTNSFVSSGWRPAPVNSSTPNAAPNSKHMTGQAIDIYDPDGELDDWLLTNYGQASLTALGLWMEHPSATKSWCHVQTVPPRSGARVFFP